MPIKIPNALPAAHILEGENIFVMDADRAYAQDIRPLKILILNLMPIKYITETQLLRLLGNSALQVEVDFIYTESYTPSHTSMDYLAQFYGTFDEVRHKKYDGMIITGAPVENMAFEEVDYHYGIPKYEVPEKIFGVFKHHLCVEHEKLLRGFDDEFYVPHSRHTEEHKEDILKVPELTILAEAEQPAGVYAIANLEKRQFFITGHAEYDPNTLKQEYDRDEKAGLHPQIPVNYYPNDDPTQKPIVRWRSVAHLLFANWLNYYVYQETPYELDAICSDRED